MVRSRSRLLELDRAPFLVRYLEELGEAGDDPSAADVDPDLDAVALLTVHQAKGLEFPVVFVANMVETRFPARGRPPRLALAAELGGSEEIVPRDPRAPETPTALDEEALREERRLAYVLMTMLAASLFAHSDQSTGEHSAILRICVELAASFSVVYATYWTTKTSCQSKAN